MDRGAWRATVPGVIESEATEHRHNTNSGLRRCLASSSVFRNMSFYVTSDSFLAHCALSLPPFHSLKVLREDG